MKAFAPDETEVTLENVTLVGRTVPLQCPACEHWQVSIRFSNGRISALSCEDCKFVCRLELR